MQGDTLIKTKIKTKKTAINKKRNLAKWKIILVKEFEFALS